MQQFAQKSANNLAIEDVYALVADDMAAVNQLIKTRLSSDVALINQLGAYIINSGGKRLRPMLVLLSANALGFEGTTHHHLAAIVEFIHTATLLHDDVVDASEKRRGHDTANSIWGNEASVLVGDFVYSRAFQMMCDVADMRVMKILADTTNTIAEGEVLQLLNCNDPDTTEARYLNVIQCKTAKLFEAAAQLGAVITKSDPALETAIARYGMHLGTAFQLVDDVLDYSVESSITGKNLGDDLAEGKPTLPLIRALQTLNQTDAEMIRDAIRNGGRQHIDAVLAAIKLTDAIDYTAEIARKEAHQAVLMLQPLADSVYKHALVALAEFSVVRSF